MPNITKSEAPKSDVWTTSQDSKTLYGLFTQKGSIDRIAKTMVKSMDPQRMMNVALSIICAPGKGSMRLLDCAPLSLLDAITKLGEVGLEPGGALQHAYLVPYRDKSNNRVLARPTISYMGYIELARRSGLLTQVEARVVHEKDRFDLKYGLDQKLEHVPYFGAEDPGEPLLVYSIARFKDGGFHVDTMSAAEVEKIRQRSPAKNDGPWVTDPGEMWKKTIIRRARKFWPQSPELARAAEIDGEDEVTNVAAAPGERPFQVITDRGLETDLKLKREQPGSPPEDAEYVNPETGEVTEAPPSANEKMAPPESDDPVSALLRAILGAKDRDTLDEKTVEAGRERKNMNDDEWADVQRAVAQRKAELQ